VSWWEAFSSGKNAWILCAYDSDELVGLAPLFYSHENSLDNRRVLTWIGIDHSDYHVFVAKHGDPGIVDALLDAIFERAPARLRIELPGVPQFSSLWASLAARAARRSAAVFVLGHTSCPWMSLTSADSDVIRLFAKRSLRRSERRLQKQFDVSFERLKTRESIEQSLDALFDCHRRRWEETAYPSLFSRQENRTFFRLLARRMDPLLELHYTELKVDGRSAAQHFGFVSGNSVLWYKPAFERELARYSPGDMLLGRLLRMAVNEGFQEFDFTRGEEAFKRRFASRTIYLADFVLTPGIRHRVATRGYLLARGAVRGMRTIIRSTPKSPAHGARVLVLDGHSAAAIEVVQSLGRAGADIDVAVRDGPALVRNSRYPRRFLAQPAATESLKVFKDWLQRTCNTGDRYALIVSTTENSLLAVNGLDDRDPLRTIAGLPSAKSVNLALDKEAVHRIALSLGVTVPRDFSESTLAKSRATLSFPLVVKPTRSLVVTDNVRHFLRPAIASTIAEMDAAIDRLASHCPVQVQEYIVGVGLGVECLYDRGQLVWAFVHERIHELPLTGGGSTYRVARPWHGQALAASKCLLDSLHWHGVAMVEFKLSALGRVTLMEINPRFWGSLALAIDAGVDFPLGLLLTVTGGRAGPQPQYRMPYYCRNLENDVEWMKENCRAIKSDPILLTQPVWRSMLEYLRPLTFRESHDFFSWRDIGLYGVLCRNLAVQNMKLAFGRMVRRPLLRVQARMAAKRLLRSLRGRKSRPAHLLFLCYGNICRSAFADVFANTRAPGLRIQSAGFHRVEGRATPAHVVAAARELNVSLDHWRSKVVTGEMLAMADIVLVMDRENYVRAVAMAGAGSDKVLMLGAFDDNADVEISDPYTMDQLAAGAVLRRITAAVDAALQSLRPPN
jgi:CelD/BcsL family acetyltransferase involved in cellulose biosynthesis/protein-tyrosine-phosphatase/predicted ATP-grasp superfamily ATP-dependent carboligase